MDRSTRWGAPALTLVVVASLGFLLLTDDGWREASRWVRLGTVCLFVGVAWLQAGALRRRGSEEAATVLIWWTAVACSFFVAFLGVS